MSNPVTNHAWTDKAHVTERGLMILPDPLTLVLPNWEWALTDMFSNQGITKPINYGLFRFEENRVLERKRKMIEVDFRARVVFVDVRPFDLGSMPHTLYRTFTSGWKRLYNNANPPVYRVNWSRNGEELKDGTPFTRAYSNPLALIRDYRTVPVLGFGAHTATLEYLNELEDRLLLEVSSKKKAERIKYHVKANRDRAGLTALYANYFGVPDLFPETTTDRINRLGLGKKWAKVASLRLAA